MTRIAIATRLTTFALLALGATGCATPTGGVLVTPWGAAGLHRFDAGVAPAPLNAALPTLENPRLSRGPFATQR